MFGAKKARIQELEQKLAVGEKQYLDALRSIEELRGILERTGGGDIVRLQALASSMAADLEERKTAGARELADLDALLEARRREADTIAQEIREKQKELTALGSRIEHVRIFSEFGLSEYTHPAESSVQLGDELAKVRSRIKEMIRAKSAVVANTDFTFNGSKAQGRKFVSDMSKMMLRAYNAEAENCVLTVKAGNGEAAQKRLERARDQVKALGKLINLHISSQYHALRQRELILALRYLNAKKAEKEAEREERARLREEARAQKEFEAAREKLAKQKAHYENVLAALEAQGRVDEAAQIRANLTQVEAEIQSVEFRAANIRAGYVYVISNIGAFGERMVKIGMTRRLEPMDRVRELGDASVPFNFDVHALFFSEDAVGVEAELHRRFADRRVNRINARREFFCATPAEVRTELASIAGNLLEFVEEPEAEQYRLSQAEAMANDKL
ncbi:DUF4041 domain-containing protein [Schaalia sp. 19OD2882]|uniref:DUF4041 domain-containing protein n=1 Tax=Schaalia sp. 19OD2882 TaxID=2794089 RepID=UPI001C1E9E99|nr:DUF4041 domain-containing protein [Schaalia sp. 19OD2882]QWW20158.1 DUF4041 domain-containing protein [Schaalia sp. 19OD2882]